VKIGYQAFYVYSAVKATDGSNISIKFPSIDTECMNVFLREISNSYPDLKTVPAGINQMI
jgi:hypothetical protein